MADPTSRVSPATVQRAVKALLKWNSSKSANQTPQLIAEDEFVYLVLTLKKIPAQGRVNSFKIAVPNPLFAAGSAEICLVLDDRSKSGLTKEAAAAKIKADGVPVSKVIKLSKLRTDYKPFEAKRKLCDSFDAFFVDRRIVPLLPRLVGKKFFKTKKIPVPVDLTHQNWREQIEKACSSVQLFLRTGTCSVVRVARISMSAEQIADNIAAAIEGIAEVVPKKWLNVRSFHLKLLESVSLPLYQSLPDSRLKIERVVEGELEAAKESNGEDKPTKMVKEGKGDGSAKKSASKGRIHEVRYMDVGENEIDEDETEAPQESINRELSVKKRKKSAKGDGEEAKLKRKMEKMSGKVKEKKVEAPVNLKAKKKSRVA